MTEVHTPPPGSAWDAPAHWRQVDFISDLHLAPELPQTLSVLRKYLSATRADALIILGDFFEIWVGDDVRQAAFEAEIAHLLQRFSRHRTLAFMAGNRDFLLGPDMAREAGIILLNDATVMMAFGQRALLTHGDAWCLADDPYQQFRKMVRSAEWQRDFLARPLLERLAYARSLRQESERRNSGRAPAEWCDIDIPTAVEWLEKTNCPTLIHGHTHRPDSQTLAPGLIRHVLSDWDMDCPQNPRAEVLQWRPDGISRRALS